MAKPDLVTVPPGETNILRIVNCLRLLVQYVQGLTSGGGNVSYGLTVVGNANYAVLTTDVAIGINTAFTAARTFTLPAASTLVDGQTLLIVDEIGGVTATNTLTIARTAPDTINGATSIVGINSAFGGVLLVADSVNNKWTALTFNADVDDVLKGRVDANFAVGTTDYTSVLQVALTAPRTATIPAASTCTSGQIFLILDEIGGVTSTNTLTLARSSTDTINGATSVVGINSAFGGVMLIPDGAANKWTAISFNTSTDTDNALTTHGDTNFTMVAADTTTALITTLTVARTATLPLANTTVAGAPYLIFDPFGSTTKALSLSVARQGSDTLNNGSTAFVGIDNPNNGAIAFSDGSSKWGVFSLVSRFIRTGTGAINRTLASVLTDWEVTPEDYGAVGGGVTDDTTACQNWAASGFSLYMPPKQYLIKNALTFSTTGQRLRGSGRDRSQFIVDSTFTLTAAGVFSITSGEPGPCISDLGIICTQVDTTARTSLTAFPPLINAAPCPRLNLQRLALVRGLVGINLLGNSGGTFIDDIETACLLTQIAIDGCQDSVRISRVHVWVFGLTANQITIFTGSASGSLTNPFTTTNGSSIVSVAHTAHTFVPGTLIQFPTVGSSVGGITATQLSDQPFIVKSVPTVNSYTFDSYVTASSGATGGGSVTWEQICTGIASGRCDDLMVSDYLSLCSVGAYFFSGSGGPTFGSVMGSDFDTFGGAAIYAGQIQFSGMVMTPTAGNNAIALEGNCAVTMSASWTQGSSTAPRIIINAGRFSGSAIDFDTAGTDVESVSVVNGEGTLAGCHFNRTSGPTYSHFTVDVGATGIIVATGNKSTALTSGSCGAYRTQADNYHIIVGCSNQGYTSTLFAVTHAVYANNN